MSKIIVFAPITVISVSGFSLCAYLVRDRGAIFKETMHSVTSSAKLLITGDKDLAAVGKYKSIKILSASDFLKKFR